LLSSQFSLRKLCVDWDLGTAQPVQWQATGWACNESRYIPRRVGYFSLLHNDQIGLLFSRQSPAEMWWHTLTHGRGSEGETGEWSGQPVPFTLPRNMVYPTLLPLMRTPRLPVVDWTDAPVDSNGPFRFAEKRNLVSARVPSHFKPLSTGVKIEGRLNNHLPPILPR